MNNQFQPQHAEFETRVSRSFDEQAVMRLIGASLVLVAPGRVEIELPYRGDLTQQDGFLHAGISSTIMDSACGYAALSLMPAAARVLTIEFKINLLAPAAGEVFRAVGTVRKPGRSVFVAESELHALDEDKDKLVATMVGTLMALYPDASRRERP